MPSTTETLFALGLGPRVVGVTRFCVHPADPIAGLAPGRLQLVDGALCSWHGVRMAAAFDDMRGW